MEPIHYATCRTPWRPLLIASSARRLVAVHFISKGGKEASLAWLRRKFPGTMVTSAPQESRRVVEEFAAYAAGELRKFTVPFDLRGTSFQIKVWKALLDIPYGETRTYAQVAQACGHPNAFRAVGLASGANPLCIIVPCHRVIGSNGGLGGFAGGLELKRKLLDHEWEHKTPAASACS